jgi:hypothetical protein
MEYYVELQDGYQVGDIYADQPEIRLHNPQLYVILEIDQANQTMLVEEFKFEPGYFLSSMDLTKPIEQEREIEDGNV